MSTPRHGLAAHRASLILLATALVWPFGAVAQYKALERDETGLSKAEQQQKNNVSFGLILGLNTTQVAAIPIGFINVPPSVGITAESAQVVADTALKFTRAVLNAPADVAFAPNSADRCSFTFELPQAAAKFKNFFGLWPKFEYGPEARFRPAHTDRLFLSSDTPINFGVLGVPEVVHANTEVHLGVLIADSTGFVEDADDAQTISLGAGVHDVEWRADTEYSLIWDTAIPAALIPVMFEVETKFGKYLEDLKDLHARKLELASVTENVDELEKLLNTLDRRIHLFEAIHKVLKPGTKVGEISADWLIDHIVHTTPTVSRSRIQLFTVYDVLPPTIATSVAHPHFEATDIGGAKTARYLPALRGSITASDSCDRPFDVNNDAPSVLPLGDTLVTWTVRDRGPVLGGVDHDGDGVPDEDPYNSRTVTQLVTVEDTQAPILVPPPGVVIESAANVNLADQALGQPLVVDLADLHPTVAKSTNSNGVVPPDTRTVVTWSATDNTGNTSLGDQLVTVKTPGTNTAPTVVDRSAKTLTSKPVDIVLTGTDTDVLPLTGAAAGGAGIPDPLQFKITQRPQHGEFVAPLYPFFIDDYRTDKVGGLIDYINAQPDRDTLMQSYVTAVSTNSLENWMNNEFCKANATAPVNFVFNPVFVQVTDDGEQYFLDRYLVCHPDVDSDWATYPRISRWDKNNVFLGAVRLDDNGGGGISPQEAVFRFDRSGFLYFVQPRTGGEPVVSIQRCPANLTNTTNNPPFCFGSFFGPIDGSQMSNRANPQNAYVDSQRGLVYLTTQGAQQRVDVFRLDNAQRVGTLSDDAGVQDFLNRNSCASPNTPFFYDAMETDSKGDFYIIDNGCNRIHKFTPSHFDDQGQFVAGSYVGWMGRCAGSNSLACDVANGRTKGFSCTVAAACTIPVDPTTIGLDSGGSLVGQLKNPSFLAIDPNDVVYVADYKNQRIQRFAPDGTFVGQAQSTGNGVNAATDGSFVLGNMGPPKHVTVNSKNFFVVDQSEHFVHVFDTSPFKDVTDSSATVSYVSKFDFHSATDTFAYAVNDGLVDSNSGIVSVAVARNYRQPLPTQQEIVLDEDNTKVIVLSGTDPDGILTRDFNGLDSLTIKIAKQPKHGKLVHGGNAEGATLDPGTDVWTYTPNRDYHGPDSFAFTVRDAFTDATVGDDGTAIPEPYGEATPAAVGIVINSVNDIPIVRISPPKRVAAGFPVLLQASAYDDTGDNYAATLTWGDGAIDRDGKVVVDQHGTPNDASDDTSALTGVVYSADGLSASGQTQMNAMHTYTATGNRKLTLCLRDGGYLEACDTITVAVESLVTLGTKVEVSKAKIADGIPFTGKITVANSVPTSVAGLDASDVHLTMELPQELRVNQISPSQGSCAVDQGVLKCSLGTLTNGASATIDLALRGVGTLIHDSDLSLLADATTASEAIDDDSLGSATVSLKAVPNDRDADGLPNIFEAVYGVSDPAADDDGDGLSNRAELDAGTSPRNADSDGDGIPDGAEVNAYHTDPLSADSDRDGVNDFDEIRVHRTDPLASDTDGDGMPDQWEVDHGFNPLVADGGGDADRDGLSDADEVRYGSDYLVADSDGDGLRDGDEVHVYGTNPAVADSDDDALDDGDELTAGTDPLKPDSDDDGLLDGEEINLYATNPLRADTDRDGLPDGWEVRHARNPLVADYALAAGGLSTCALTDRGVQCWGRNDVGQAPALVAGLVHPEQITVGFAHACAIDRAANGTRSVKCWGDNTYGQRTPPTLVEPLQIAAGAYYNCALDRTGAATTAVKCWGRNDHGQVSGLPTGLTNPVRLVSAVSGSSSCVIDARPAGPALVCWGQYNNANSAVPGALTSVLDPLALGSEHGCVVDSGNRLCWGLNDQGQAPPGPTPSRAVDLALGGFHSCALEEIARDRYHLACWGRNIDGQATVPATLVAPIDVVTGSHHSCVLDQGSAKCWGQNTDGEAPASGALSIDPDGDGLSTALEIARGTDPLDSDTDRDLLSDSVEIATGTDPLDSDSDDDGVLDGEEVNVRHTNPLASDTDGDGVPDGWEIDHGSSPTVADASSDADGDGLTSREECEAGTDPNLADTDGDGLSDGAELNVFRYGDTGQALGTAISEAVELGDLDGDGDLDALVANRGSPAEVWLNDGKANFTRSAASAFNTFDAVDVALFDADGDGDLDAVLAHSDPNIANSLWVNDGHAVFSPAGSTPPPTFSSDGVKFGRFTQSGAKGLFVANWGPNQAYTLQPPFTLTPVAVTDPLGGNSEDVALGDLNGDGLDDAFVVNRQQPAQVFMNIGGRFIEAQELGTNDFAIAVDLGDIDNDGDLDAYQVNFGAGDKIWLNDGHGRFTDSGQSLGNDGGNDVRLVDVNRDGYPEAIVANTGPNRVWRNAKGTLSDSGIAMGNETTYGLAVGDLDGDGDPDIFFANDGPNTVWLLEQLKPANADTDGDGASDGWEVAHGLDPLDAADGDLDLDGDGLDNRDEFDADTDPRVADSDGDGIPDGFEVSHGLDPTTDDAGLDLDGDGVANLVEYRQGLDPQADDAPPNLTVPANVTVRSTGALTAVVLGTATAIDARDGAATATPDDAGPFAPGRHRVTWSAADVSGNVAQAVQTVDVIPQVNFGVDQRANEGDTVHVAVQLNGPAVAYPVLVGYTVSGAATNPEDHDAAAGTVTIAAGTEAEITIHIAKDSVFEGEETFTLAMGSVANAVTGPKDNHTITIVQENIKPSARIVMRQGGKRVTTAAADGGPVEVTAEVTDPNVSDSHTFDWSSSDGGAFDPADFTDASYVIDPALLGRGTYQITLDIADNGIPIATNRAHTQLRVMSAAPALSASADSDRDGIADATEGAGDADGDGVPDYLDPGSLPNTLVYSADGYLIDTQAGLTVRLGTLAFAQGSVADVTEQSVAEDIEFGYPDGVADFEVIGVEPGNAAKVVLPLHHPIPANARYRKHAASGWQDFVVGANDSIASAPGSKGACPTPGDPAYVPGLHAGDACLELAIQDGGPNDADGQADGTIVDPSGLAVPVGVRLEMLPVTDRNAVAGTLYNVVLALRLTSDSGDSELDSLTLRASGSGDDRQIRSVKLYVDANGNGAVDPGEAGIASGTFDQDNGLLVLKMSAPYAIPSGQTDLLVTFDL